MAVPKPYLYRNERKRPGAERIDQGRSPRGGPRVRRAGSGGGRPFLAMSPKAGTERPRAPVARAPERRRSSRPPRRAEARKRRASGAVMHGGRSEAPRLRGCSIYGPRRSAGTAGRPRMRGGAKRLAKGSLAPGIPSVPSALPRWSCRHPVCGRVSRPRRGGGAYNNELVAAKGRSPEGGRRPAARGTAGENFLKKVLDTAERAR